MKRTLFVIGLGLALVLVSSPLPADQPPPFLLKWGSQGSGDGEFQYPIGVAVDNEGNVYVGDHDNNRVQKFTSDGQFLTKWGSQGSGDGQFQHLTGVAVDSQGNVYVVDGNNCVQKFTSDGRFLTKWGSQGSGDGQFLHPSDVTVDSHGNVYVPEYDNNRVQKFTSDGQFLTKWGNQGSGDGQFQYPSGVAVDSQGNVYVADIYNNRIQKFTSDGLFLTKWGSQGLGDGQFQQPFCIAFNSQGDVYVTDHSNHRVQKFGCLSAHHLVIGDVGNDQGRFVRINFIRDGRDAYNSVFPILQYEAYRWIDPLLSSGLQISGLETDKLTPSHQALLLRGWEYVEAIPAHGESEYNMIVPTLADSTADKGIYWSKFFIRATTASPLVFFDSPVDSGYSVDNLAPNVPLNFDINKDGFLVWDQSLDKDLRYYTIYASNSSVFDGSKVVFGRTTNTIYDARLGTTKYYYLTATDFAGNESKPASTELRPISVLLTAFTAERRGANVFLKWDLSEAVPGVSFEVFRGEESSRLLLSPQPLKNTTSYTFTDSEAPMEATQYWLKSVSAGQEEWHGPVTVAKAPPLPLSLQAYPNPFNPGTTLTYYLPEKSEVSLSVYDASGRLVKTLVNHEPQESGQHNLEYQLDGASGVYFLRLISDKQVKTEKIVLLK